MAAFAMEAGAAKVDISPPLGTPLNGYLERWGRGALSVHDPIWARSLYLDDGQTAVFLVSADLCVINRELRDKVIELAGKTAPGAHIILTATHNHNGPGGMVKGLLFRSISGRYMPEMLDAEAQGIADAIAKSYASRKRAVVGFGAISQNDLSVNRMESGGPIDPQIGILRVEDADGAPIAIATNFAAHPTTIGKEDGLSISADFPGYYYQTLEALATGCVALYLNGAVGDQSCANPENKEGWERTESIGRLLAQRVSVAAEHIICGETPLHYASAERALPPTLASSFLPASTFLSVLEIGDVAFMFTPGEPCAEIGSRLRLEAFALGYTAQCTVGLAEDHCMYFVPQANYARLSYESAMSFYGPGMDEWLSEGFAGLLSRGKPADKPAPPAAAPREDASMYFVRLSGAPYAMGYQRGAAFKRAIGEAFQQLIVGPCDTGALIPDTGWWKQAPGFINVTPMALPRLGIGARPMLAGLPAPLFDDMRGMADGAGIAFDAAWLLQCAPVLAEQANVAELYRSQFCTVFATVGDRAGADDLLVGRNFDGMPGAPIVVYEMQPDAGRRYFEVGFPWSAGAYSGMNDAGVVVCAERTPELGAPSLDGPPVDLLLRQVLEQSATLNDALAILNAAAYLRGYHILVGALEPGGAASSGASATAKGSAVPATGAKACVAECGPNGKIIRQPDDGMLLGQLPSALEPGSEAAVRYAHAEQLLRTKRIAAAEAMREFLQNAEGPEGGRARIYNGDTRYSVVFEPREGRISVACPRPDGSPGAYQSYELAGASTVLPSLDGEAAP